MVDKKYHLLDEAKLSSLRTSLNFLHVEELANICLQLSLPNKGKKISLIARILHFIRSGQIIIESKVPAISKARRGVIYVKSSTALMLKGNYKNDLQSRIFFKNLIGEHFHFTAFGIDWLNERWLSGNPPTYQEFANMWQEEYQKTKEERN